MTQFITRLITRLIFNSLLLISTPINQYWLDQFISIIELLKLHLPRNNNTTQWRNPEKLQRCQRPRSNEWIESHQRCFGCKAERHRSKYPFVHHLARVEVSHPGRSQLESCCCSPTGCWAAWKFEDELPSLPETMKIDLLHCVDDQQSFINYIIYYYNYYNYIN